MTDHRTTRLDALEPDGDGIDFILRLRPERGVNAEQALRAALKRLGRSYGLRCIEARPVMQDAARGDSGPAGQSEVAHG